jgi:hypothetical protein
MPTPRRCSGCGAALGQPTDDDLTIVCTFCGLRHDINDLAAAGDGPGVIVVGPPPPARLRAMMFVILAVVAATTAASLFVAYRSASMATTLVGDTTTRLRQPATDPPRPATLALADLASLTDFAWKVVDTPPPPEGYAVFAPVAAIPWAMTIARAWASDAVLTRIDVGRVSSTGVVDLSGERTSGYRFTSPGRAARWKQETDAGSRSLTKTSLMLEIRGETVRAIVDDSDRDVQPTPTPTSLPLNEILARAAKSPRFGQRPFYGGYMIHLPREGWVWYLSPPSGGSLPRVRASDGRVFPY